ncbi:hypothetical protein [Intrasporangium sp. DVR]|uniref:hypothetical protein n=1 Tax=Intrasporangium sp. DVR TaxID=3127867 RepID=UPI00313A4EF1
MSRLHGSGPDLSRVEAAHKDAPAGTSALSVAGPGDTVREPHPGYTFDDLQAAYLAGIEQGRMERVDVEAEQRAYELVHERAVEALGLARSEASKVGPAWAALVEDAAAVPWREEWSA